MNQNERIGWSKTVIDTALNNPGIQKQLAKFGLNKEDLLTGQGHLDEVIRLGAMQRKEKGERFDATDELNVIRAQAKELYTKHVADARHALRDERGHWEALGLEGRRKDEFFAWLAQAETFYGNIDPVMPTLKKYNVTEAEVTEARNLLVKVVDAYQNRNREASEAKVATRLRNEALQSLDNWMKRLKQTAELAFADEPQHLETLGFTTKVA